MSETLQNWTFKTIEQICSVRTEKFNPKQDSKIKKYIGLEHINSNTGVLNGVGMSNDTLSMKNVFFKNDVLFGKLRPYLRKYWFATFNGVCTTEVLPLVAKDNIESLYLYYLVQSNSFINYLSNRSFGTRMPRTSWKDISEYEVQVPTSIKEQQKVSSILSSVDEAIEKTEKIIEQTETVKKGLMQELLTKGIGHTEFKGSPMGNIPQTWSVKPLHDLITEKPTYGSGDAALSYHNNLPRYIRITDITNDGYLSKQDCKSVNYVGNEKYILNDKDLLFARTGNTVGKSYLYTKEEGTAIYAGYLIRFKLNKEVINPKFVFHVTHSQYYRNWVKSMLRTGAQPNINAKEYSTLLIPIPPKEEQIKIIEIIDRVQDKIRTEFKWKEKLYTIKKGLMQQLLTGKVRVKVDDSEEAIR